MKQDIDFSMDPPCLFLMPKTLASDNTAVKASWGGEGDS